MDASAPAAASAGPEAQLGRGAVPPSVCRQRSSSRELADPESLTPRRSVSRVSPSFGPPKAVAGAGDCDEYDEDGHVKRTGAPYASSAASR